VTPLVAYEQALSTWSDLGPHLKRLHDLTVEIAAQQVIELGVRSGVSTSALLAAVEETGGRVWSCDIEDHRAPDAVASNPRWTFHLGDDRRSADSAPERCDLLFIDTSHKGAHTRTELALYGPRVREGGIIVLHDADLPGVFGPAYRYAQAVERTLTYYPGSHGLAVIR